MYIADYDNNRIRKVNTAGIITTIAGNGIAGYSGDEGNATAAELYYPVGVTCDAAGEVVMEPITYHSQNFTVGVSQLSTGVYIVELSNSSGKSVKRLIKE